MFVYRKFPKLYDYTKNNKLWQGGANTEAEVDLEGRVQAHRVKLEGKEQLTGRADSVERLTVAPAVEANPHDLN